jgi:hypothetical protein
MGTCQPLSEHPGNWRAGGAARLELASSPRKRPHRSGTGHCPRWVRSVSGEHASTAGPTATALHRTAAQFIRGRHRSDEPDRLCCTHSGADAYGNSDTHSDTNSAPDTRRDSASCHSTTRNSASASSPDTEPLRRTKQPVGLQLLRWSHDLQSTQQLLHLLQLHSQLLERAWLRYRVSGHHIQQVRWHQWLRLLSRGRSTDPLRHPRCPTPVSR